MAEKKESRIVFMGTPRFAARILERLIGFARGNVIGVVTRVDKPARRGHKLLFSPVKEVALAHSIPCLQPSTLKSEKVVNELRSLAPDFLIVAAYGLILPKSVLELPTFPPLNVHGSLLPLYRGAAPVQRAIMENCHPNDESGVSIMQMVEELDAGPVFAQKRIAIQETTSDQYLDILSEEGSELLLTVLDALLEGRAKSVIQDENKATYAAKLDKSDGIIRWNADALTVHAQIRAVTSKPGASTVMHIGPENKTYTVQLLPGKIESESKVECGKIAIDSEGILISCSDRWYRLGMIKPEGKSFMNGKAFKNGYLKSLENGVCGYV